MKISDFTSYFGSLSLSQKWPIYSKNQQTIGFFFVRVYVAKKNSISVTTSTECALSSKIAIAMCGSRSTMGNAGMTMTITKNQGLPNGRNIEAKTSMSTLCNRKLTKK